MVRDENLQQQSDHGEKHRHQMAIPAGYKFDRFAHGGEIGGDIEGIGYQEQIDDAEQHDRRKRRLNVGGELRDRYRRR